MISHPLLYNIPARKRWHVSIGLFIDNLINKSVRFIKPKVLWQFSGLGATKFHDFI